MSEKPTRCGSFTAAGHTEFIHVIRPGASACVCGKNVIAPRAAPVERCSICGKITKGGHERDGSDLCWGHYDEGDT